MKIAFFITIVLHGLIHMLGFLKGFDLKEIKELTLHISKPIGIFWLIASIVLLAFGVLHFINSKYAWIVGLLAITLSQVLIFMFWKDAKFGTIPNIIIFAVSLTSFGYYNFHKIIQQETLKILEDNGTFEDQILNELDLLHLPSPVKSWLMNSGSIGKPFIRCGRVSQIAEMQMQPHQKNWLNATATQYTTIDQPAFIWSVDVKMNSLLSFQGRDKYENGKGEMLIKLNSLFNIVNERGKKLDEGTLQRYLGEMVWFPSLALSPYITWEEIDKYTAKATMRYEGTSASGNFYFNSNGEVTKFSAMRYKGNEPEAKKYPWIMNILGYKIFEGIKVPAIMTSTWKLEDQDWTWLKMEVTDIKYNQNVSK